MQRLSNKEMKQVNIEGDEFHPDWNYTIPTPIEVVDIILLRQLSG